MPAKNMVWEIAMEISRFPCIIWRSVLSCLLKSKVSKFITTKTPSDWKYVDKGSGSLVAWIIPRVGSQFGQMVSKLKDWQITIWNCVYCLHRQIAFTENGPKSLKLVSKIGLKKWNTDVRSEVSDRENKTNIWQFLLLREIFHCNIDPKSLKSRFITCAFPQCTLFAPPPPPLPTNIFITWRQCVKKIWEAKR